MKILLVIEGTFPWYRGGVSEWVNQYLRYFSDYEFDIFQIATDEFRFAELNRAVYQVPAHVNKLIRVPVPELATPSLRGMEKWWKVLANGMEKNTDYRFVHVTNTGFAGYAGMRLSQFYDIPLLLTEHAIYWKEVELGTPALECGYKLPDEDELKMKYVGLFREIAGMVYSAASATVSVSETNIPFQKELGADKPLVIPNGVPEEWVKPLSLPIETEIFTLGWVGRCAAMKNPHKFLDVVEVIKQTLTIKVHFLLVMSDAGEYDLEQEIRERVNRIGGIELIWNQSAVPALARMDAVIITSVNESQPLVIFEALAHNCLPVGWEVGDFNSRFGFCVKPTMPIPEFVHQLSVLMNSRDKWYELLKTRKKTLMEYHVWSKIFRTYETVMKKILS